MILYHGSTVDIKEIAPGYVYDFLDKEIAYGKMQ